MRSNRCASIFWLVVSVLLLSACAAPGPQRSTTEREQAYADRFASLQAWQSWGFTGRLGMDDGEDGGSGRLDWNTEGDSATLQFRGALGQGAWQLETSPSQARLALSDGSVRQAPSVDALVWQEIGWQLPVSAFSWWVRGLAWPDTGGADSLQLNDDGTPAMLKQMGWTVSYDRYVDHAGEQLPGRLLARQGDVQVKLAVRRWHNEPH